MALVGDEVAGDPIRDVRWIRRSLRKLERALARTGQRLSHTTIGRVLRAHRIRAKANVKHLTPRAHPDRDRQFRHLLHTRRRFERAGMPVISVDTKKKELIGRFKNAGRAWNRHPPEVYSHDFPSDATAKAVPYGVYDPVAHHGAVYVGLSHDTPDFAVTAIAQWWRQIGRRRYPGARRLLILADSGGSNGYRPRRWKTQLQARLVEPYRLTVTVCHYPPGASKWNPIEHLLFSQISGTWAGLPLTSVELMIGAIRATTTETGLKVRAALIRGDFPCKVPTTPKEWKALWLTRHRTCPKWNYTLRPRKSGK